MSGDSRADEWPTRLRHACCLPISCGTLADGLRQGMSETTVLRMGVSMRDGHLRFCLTALLVTSVTAFAHAVPQSAHVDSGKSQGADYEIAGCLRSSYNGASNATPSSVVYTLEERTNPNAKAPAATSGTAVVDTSPRSAATATPSNSTYTLSAPASVGLANHVGHKVLLTGHLQTSSGDANASANPRPSSTATHPAPAGGAHRTLQISALKMISTTCE